MDPVVIIYCTMSHFSQAAIENIYHRPVRQREPFSEAGQLKLPLFFPQFTPSPDSHVYVETEVLARSTRWSFQNTGKKLFDVGALTDLQLC